MKKIKFYLWLCYVNFFISSFTFGGGYVVVPMIRKFYVEEKQLFTEKDLMDLAAIAQSSPGAIAINLSVLAGKKAAGYIGALISGICSLIPPIIILAIVSHWYHALIHNPAVLAILKGMQACVAAMMVDIVIDMTAMITKERKLLLNLLIPFAFFTNFFFHLNVVLILLIAALSCLLSSFNLKGRLD